MKPTILTGVLVLAAGVPALMAQATQPQSQANQPQAGQSQPAAHQPQPKSKEEAQALQAIVAAQDPDARIQASENLLTKFADTDYKELALFMEAASYQQKNDLDKMQIYAERTLEVNPKNFQAMLMIADKLAMTTREHDLDRDEKLAKGEKYANGAIDELKVTPKPNPQITDQQWDDAKKDLTAEAHNALGLMAMTRKKNDIAINEFKAAVDDGSHVEPAYEVRLAFAYQADGKNDDAIALCDKIMADPQAQPSIKSAAKGVRDTATQAKSGGAKPAPSNNTVPQVEIKK
ncbi:MAG TPA: hypothetical protein VG675_23360 [Bryobacteraceae bacterium]|nr:hypothetical protein [Bryobacteraceae bacterium]